MEGALSTGSESVSSGVTQQSGDVSTDSSIGSYDVVIPEEIRPSGRQADFATGSETVIEGGGVTVSVTGILSTISTGSVSVADQVIGVTGVSAELTLGAYVQWGRITPSQTPSWAQISPSQTPGWTTITPSQTPEWEKIAA